MADANNGRTPRAAFRLGARLPDHVPEARATTRERDLRPNEPELERAGDRLYLITVTGERWRVHDAVFRAGKHVRLPLEDPRATSRIFVNATGTRRLSRLTSTAAHTTADAGLLAEQLQGAEYLGTATFDPASVDPGRHQ